jgi:hypothetical protein
MTTSTFLFADNASTVLAAPISSTATSLTVASGTGSLFPNPGTNQLFALSLNDRLTQAVYEIVYCTRRVGDVMTVIRGQEGTAKTTWLANDYIANWITAGQQANFLQRTQLQTNLNLYVNGSTGSNSNNGLTSGTAFATFNYCWTYLLDNYDLNGFTVTINQAGTNHDTLSANGNAIGAINTASVTINVGGTWSVTNGSCILANNSNFLVTGSGTLSASGSGIGQGFGIAAFSGAQINFQGITFGNCTIAGVYATQNGQIANSGSYTIAGGGVTHINSNFGANIQISLGTVTLTGTPGFITAFAAASDCATINSSGVTWSGSAAGPRYLSQRVSSIYTAGAGANYFPGNSAGSTPTGGQYN